MKFILFYLNFEYVHTYIRKFHISHVSHICVYVHIFIMIFQDECGVRLERGLYYPKIIYLDSNVVIRRQHLRVLKY